MKKFYFSLILFGVILSLNSVKAQTGTTCASAHVISTLPFTATGLTTAGTSYASLPCSGTGFTNYMSGKDYVFTYTPPSNQTVTITLTNTSVAVGLFITNSCPDAVGVACIANNNSPGGNPGLSNQLLTGGTTYYIIVSFASIATAQTNFDILVTTCSGAPTAGFTYSAIDTTVTFTNTSSNGAIKYLWYFGDEQIILPPPYGGDTTTSPVHAYASFGTFNAMLIAYNSCGSTDTLIIPITLACAGTLPVADFTYNIINNDSVVFTNTSSNGTSYKWMFGDELISNWLLATAGQNQTHTYTADSTYIVQMVASNICGTDTFSIPITIIGTGISTTGNEKFISIFPNPVKDILTISLNNYESEKTKVSIINLVGQEIYSEEIIANKNIFNKQINLKNTSKGIYFLKLQTGNNSSIKKIIVE